MKVRYLLFGMFILTVVVVLAGSGYARVDPETIAGMWLFDEGKGGDARDSSGNENDGEIKDAEWVDGRFGKALEFDDDDWVRVEHSDVFNITDEITLAAWLKWKEYKIFDTVIGKHTQNYRFFLNANQTVEPRFTGFAAGGNLMRSKATVPFGEWTHVAVTFDGEEFKIYLNGKFDSSHKEPGKMQPNINPVIIGNWEGGGRAFNGILDEVVIFNVALGEEDIQSIMTRGLERALGITAVSSAGKFPTVWGQMKAK